MITEAIKNKAIFRLRDRETAEDIAKDMELPLPLVLEWESKLDQKDLTQLQSNIHAVQTFANGDILLPSSGQEELLRLKIEEIAIEIVDQVSLTVSTPDIMRAKTLQLCADTVTKLYDSLINKKTGGSGEPVKPNGRAITAFQSIMKE